MRPRMQRMQRQNEATQRTCVGCMQRDHKARMLRIAAQGEKLTLDEEARIPGRGAYLHKRDGCISNFVHNKAKELRSLKRTINFDQRRELAALIRARLDTTTALE
jgi:uncharacterized protein